MANSLHFHLTRRVEGWISSRATGAGFNWATEVYLAQSYVADAVVIASLQHRFWLAAQGNQRPTPERLVIVFETKVSRSDFLWTFKNSPEANRKSPIGNLHYLVIPPNLNCIDHLPAWWGILQQSGRGLRELRPATFSPITDHQLYHAAFRVLLASHRNPSIFITSPSPDIGAANNELTIQTSTNLTDE